jgi:hypothetical protein
LKGTPAYKTHCVYSGKNIFLQGADVRLAYGFLCVNYKGLAKVFRFLVRAFFSQDFKNP